MSKKKATKGADEEGGGGGKKKVVAGGLVLVLAAAAWFFLLRSPSAATPTDAAPEPGKVVALDSITINLAGGHFLRLGLGLQLAVGKTLAAEEAHAEEAAAAEADPVADGAKALDAAIEVFSGKPASQLAGAGRTKARQALVHELQERYEGAVLDVYFTEFVMQ